jgi:hypothetical protein
MDEIFGTFCPAFKENDQGGAKMRPDAKATLFGVPSAVFVFYLAASAACVVAPGVYMHFFPAQPAVLTAAALAVTAGFGPVAVAWVLSSIGKPPQGGSDARQSWSSILVQVVAGVACCPVPVAWAAYLAVMPPPSP